MLRTDSSRNLTYSPLWDDCAIAKGGLRGMITQLMVVGCKLQVTGWGIKGLTNKLNVFLRSIKSGSNV